MNTPHNILSGSVAALLRKSHLALAAASLCFAATGYSQNITFGAATTIAGDADVFTLGLLNYAYDLSNTAQTLNGVSFAAGASTTNLGSDVTMSGFDGGNNGTAFGSAGGGTWAGLSGAYQNVLRGGSFTNAGTTATVNLNNLTSGHVYATQVWVHDNRDLGGGLNRSEVISSTGGNSIGLDYNNTNGNGGVGQFTIGGFTAASTSQAFTLLANNAGSQSSQFNALQVRDVTGIWSGATNGAWDGGTANFTGGQIFATVVGLTPSVSFADTDGFKNAVTNSNITVASGGASIGTVNFQNNAVNYTFDSADANGITGASIVNKTGTGTVTFRGANTYTGATSVNNGILTFGNTAARSSGTTVTAAAAGTVGLGVGAVSGDYSDANVADLFNTNTLSGFNLDAASGVAIDTTAGNFTQSTALTAARALTKLGNNTLILTGANSYSGTTTVRAGTLQVGNGGTAGTLGSGAVINNGNLVFFRNDTTGFNPTGIISGTGNVAYNGPAVAVSVEGQYLVDDANTYSGTTTINNARAQATSGTAFGTGPVTVNSGGQVYVSAAVTINNPITINGNGWAEPAGALGAIRLNGGTIAGAVTLASNSRISSYGGNGVISGPISGGFNLDVTGQVAGNTIALSGVNTYTGATNISVGTLSISVASGAARRFDASGLGLTNGGNVTAWSDISGNGANASVPGGNAAPTFIADAGTGTGLGAINFLGNTNANNSQALTYARDTNVRSIFSIFKGSSFLATDSSTYALHRNTDTTPTDPLLNGNANGGFSGYVNGAAVNPYATPMPAGTNGYNLVSLLNSTPFALNGFNKDRTSHSGNQSQAEVIIFDTVVSETQRLQIETFLNKKWFGTGSGIGNLLPTTTAVTISSGGTLDISGENFQTVASLSATDGTGNKLSLGAAALTFGDANDNTFDGAISGVGSLTKIGSGKQTLTGASTFSGRTTISNGTLELGGAAGKLGTGPITNNTTLRLNRTNALTVAGAIDGPGTLTQVGTGTTTLSGVSTYSGATTITAGTLRPAVAGGSSLWLDSAKTSSIATSGTAVTQWNDAGGGANFATQGNAAARANLKTDSAFTGPSKTMVDFGATTSSGQWMQFNNNITDIRSVFWVMKGGNFLLGSTAGAYDFHREEAGVASPTGKIWSTPYTSGNIQNGQTYLNGTQVNGTTTALSGGYQMIDLITAGDVQANALANDRGIAGRVGGQQIGEVIIFNAALNNTERQQVETYLNYKWFGTGTGVGNLLPVNTPVTISGNGTLDLSGENYQTIASLSSPDSTTRVTLGSAALTVGDANDTTFAGVISDTGTLTKVGSGKLTLTGANTNSGRTTISNGTLEISGAAGKLGAGPITNNAALRFSPITTLSVPVAIDGTGGLTHAGTGTTTLSGALTYGGATDISGGTLRIVGAPTAPVAGTARHFDASNLGLADGAGVSTWNDLSGNGANATVPGGNATPTYIANAGTGTGLGAINLPKNGGAATSGAFTFTRDANVRSMFSIFKGNSFLATDATGGTYALHRPTDDNAADALLADYGQINYLGSVYVNGSLVGTPLTTPMPTNVANGYNLVEVITNGNAFALDSFNKDRGNIHAGNQSQAEVLIYDTVLTESQRLHNESYLSNKWFGTGAAAALPSNTPVTISNGGTLDLIGAQTIGSLSSTDALGSKVINDTSLTVGNATNTTFDGVISGPGTLTKTGTGRLTLAGANTYAGVTTISNGTLELAGSAGALGTSTGVITNNGTLLINRTNALTLRNAITGTGSLTQAGNGTTTLTGTSTYAGATNITSGTLSVSVVTGAARRFDASGLGLANGGNVTTWNDLSGNGANATVPGGNEAPTYIANAGTGTGLGAINFLGKTNATDSQALSFTRDTNVRSMFSIFKGSSFLATDSVDYPLHRATDNNPADPLLINYGQINFLGSVYVNSSLVATPFSTPMPTGTNNGYNLVEVIGNGNAFALDSFNKDRIFHSGNQSQAEVILFDTVVSNEQRQQIETYLNYKWFGTGAGIGNLLPATTPVTLSGGGTLDLGGENFQTFASLSSSDPTSRVTLGAAALTVGDASSTTFAGAISGPGKLTKVGNGTLTLAGTSNYTGPTTVNAGTLIVSGSISGSAVTVDGSGSTLGGGGTINGTVTVQNGATLAPGNSPGKLSTLSLSMASGTTLSLELNGATPVTGYDQLSVTGTVDLGGSTLSISTGVGFVNGDYFVVLNDGTDAITGTFTGLAEGGMFSVGDKDFTITYTANAEGMSLTGGNDVAFTVVPEPGSAMLLLGGLATMLGVRRRRVLPS